MKRFSIVVPIYNTEKYLEKCLDSILNQSYNNFEVILVNDGSKDNSEIIIDKYVKKDKRLKKINKENGGLSSARNEGIKLATGEYLIFVDSDDTINEDLLKEVNAAISNNKKVDVVRYKACRINGESKEYDEDEPFEMTSGYEAFKRLCHNALFAPACLYAYKREFWLKNNFEYELGRYHEDYGLTPYIIIKAKSVVSIDYTGYNYFIRENSIMTSKDEKKERKKNEDTLYLFDTLIKKVKEDKNIDIKSQKLFNSYMANGLITKASSQEGENKEILLKEISKRKVYKYLLDDTLGRKIKRILFKYMPKMSLNLYK